MHYNKYKIKNGTLNEKIYPCYILATFYAYKSQAEFQANKYNWIRSASSNLKPEDFKSLENVKYDKLVGFYLKSEDLKSLKNELESEAIEFKNNSKSDEVNFVQAYVYADDDYNIDMITDISYDFSEK